MGSGRTEHLLDIAKELCEVGVAGLVVTLLGGHEVMADESRTVNGRVRQRRTVAHSPTTDLPDPRRPQGIAVQAESRPRR